MENPTYRIKGEVIGDEKDNKIGNFLREGTERDGFAIIAKEGKRSRVIIEGINIIDLACSIAGDDDMMAASVIAKALREARTITEDKSSKILAGILGSIGN